MDRRAYLGAEAHLWQVLNVQAKAWTYLRNNGNGNDKSNGNDNDYDKSNGVFAGMGHPSFVVSGGEQATARATHPFAKYAKGWAIRFRDEALGFPDGQPAGVGN